MNTTTITVETVVNASIEKIWNCWNEPQHITQWNQASEDWCAPRAINDLRTGGKFLTRMEAKDGSVGFDFEGTYSAVENHKQIEYIIADGRKVKIQFLKQGDAYKVIESFEAETINSIDLQKGGWQAILNSFKKYVETH
jgi:uncharacterized protein YndB with AHSA1/START domain